MHDTEWPSNYFNYFTEIEEHFQRARGTALFLLSPLDWALIEHWKNSAVPLEAVLQGIDEAFEKWRSRKVHRRHINGLAYCAQAVAEAAKRVPSRSAAAPSTSPFAEDEVRTHLAHCIAEIGLRPEQPFVDIAASLNALLPALADLLAKPEDLERRLTALEDKMVAAARTVQSDEDLYTLRESLDRELRPFRGKMTADQIAMLERRYLDTALLERAKLPRLSLFYLHS